MSHTNFEYRRRMERLDGEALAQHQLHKLNRMLDEILPQNKFYAHKLAGLKLPLESLEQLADLPFTYKDELVGEQARQIAAHHTWPPEHYVRLHRTSGTRGRPLAILDTAEDWRWWIETWQYVLDAAELTPADCVFMAFSFGPFIGFWSAFDAAVARGCLVVPGGGLSTEARLELIATCRATAILCTPTYAMRMAEVAAESNTDLTATPVRHIIVAGEPGGSTPAIRERIESAWGAKVIDHSGATEVGPWGYADAEGAGLHVVESEFIAEFRSLASGEAATEGELSELIVTTLGRYGSPVIRYRTGDLVRPQFGGAGNNHFVHLDGGVLGRTDDMMIIRGVNIFPGSIEQILRGFPEVVEYRITATKKNEMDALSVEVEDRLKAPERIAKELHIRIGLKVQVKCVPPGSLPRFEAKGRRFVDLRNG